MRLTQPKLVIATLLSSSLWSSSVDAAGVTPGSSLRHLAPNMNEDLAAFPESFRLPDGFQPEGIVAGKGTKVYVSCTGGPQAGSIWKGDVKNGNGEVLVPATGDATRGIAIDSQNRLWVAWIFGARVYDTDSGALLKEYSFVTADAIVNDVIVTESSVIFTDSGATKPNGRGEVGAQRLFILSFDAAPGNSLPQEFVELAVQGVGGLDLDTGFPALNGIETMPGDDDTVLVCHTNLGILLLVDLSTGDASTLEIDGADAQFSTCDGLVRRDDLIYVVRNRDTATSAVRIDASDGFSSTGSIKQVYELDQIIGGDLDTPTTGALYGDYLYMPDSKFGDCRGVDCSTEDFYVYRFAL